MVLLQNVAEVVYFSHLQLSTLVKLKYLKFISCWRLCIASLLIGRKK